MLTQSYVIYGNAKSLVGSPVAQQRIAAALRRSVQSYANPVMGLAPAAEHRAQVAAVLHGSPVLLGVQTLKGETESTLREDNVAYAIAHHVERRTFRKEVEHLPQQMVMARKAGVRVVLLLGPMKGSSLSREELKQQINFALKGIDIEELDKIGIDLVYEPGESVALEKPAPIGEIEQGFKFIQEIASEDFPKLTNYRILYGGGVGVDTFDEVKDLRDLSPRFGGFIVGGASTNEATMSELGEIFARHLGRYTAQVPRGGAAIPGILSVERKYAEPLKIAILGREKQGEEIVNMFLATLSEKDGIVVSRFDRGKMQRGDVAAALRKDAYLTAGLSRDGVKEAGENIVINGVTSMLCQPIKGKAKDVVAAMEGSALDVLVVTRADLMNAEFMAGAAKFARHILLVPNHQAVAKARELANIVINPPVNGEKFDPIQHKVVMLPFDEDGVSGIFTRVVADRFGETAIQDVIAVVMHQHTGEASIGNRGVGAENQSFVGQIRPFPVRTGPIAGEQTALIASTRQPMLYAGAANVIVTVVDPNNEVNRDSVKAAFAAAAQAAPAILAIASNADGTLMFARESQAATLFPTMLAVTNPTVRDDAGNRITTAIKKIVLPGVFSDLGTAHQLKRALWVIGNALGGK